MESEGESGKSVEAVVELSGKYEDIAELLATRGNEHPQMASIVDDMGRVVDIVTRTGGATKSRVASDLPSGTAGELDGESVIYLLRVLELYGVVRLDGNTWRPGPALSTGQGDGDG